MKEIRERYMGGLTDVKEFKTAMTSLEVAELVGKEHKNVMRDIREEIEQIGIENSKLIFEPSFYDTKYRKNLEIFNLNELGCRQMGMRWSAKDRFTINVALEQNNKPMTIEDMMMNQLQSMKDLKIEMEEVKDKVDNKMGLSGSQAYCIQNLVNKRVYSEAKKLFEVEELTVNIKKSIRPMFSEINKLIKIKFGISHRNDIPQSKYEEATDFINNWYISLETQLKVINKFEELVK